jgi:hypothetical protein
MSAYENHWEHISESLEQAQAEAMIKAAGKDALEEKTLDMMTPGYAVECDPEEAEALGAFREDALEPEEALDASNDV